MLPKKHKMLNKGNAKAAGRLKKQGVPSIAWLCVELSGFHAVAKTGEQEQLAHPVAT